jgi:TonB family protein
LRRRWVEVLVLALVLTSLAHSEKPWISLGEPVQQVRPKYPKEAQKAKVEGPVVVQATIAKDGHVRDVVVVSGHPMLADAAHEAVRKWRYQPFKIDGVPVEVETRVTVHFKLAQLEREDQGPEPTEVPPACQSESHPGVLRMRQGGPVTAPRPIHAPDPPYTRAARRAKEQGEVVFRFVVTKEGGIRDACVVRSSVSNGLIASAHDTLKQWKFEPAAKAGEPVEVMIETSFHFRLYNRRR